MELDENEIKTFQQKIFKWWKNNKRDLPWRKTTNPYYIMVSEVMLQQTQVSRIIPKYLEFIASFPTIEKLAKASPAEVLKIWSGLGYNKRALWLQEAAKQILDKGSFPENYQELQKLRGIGSYTARSILIFAMNKNYPTIDTNIRRILIAEGFALEKTQEKELYQIAEKILPKGKSREWHNALMDYGSLVLTVAKTGIKPLTSQTNFSKSNRYYRGKIVKLLTLYEKQTKEDLIRKCKINEEKINELLPKLIKDRLIARTNEFYHLPTE